MPFCSTKQWASPEPSKHSTVALCLLLPGDVKRTKANKQWWQPCNPVFLSSLSQGKSCLPVPLWVWDSAGGRDAARMTLSLCSLPVVVLRLCSALICWGVLVSTSVWQSFPNIIAHSEGEEKHQDCFVERTCKADVLLRLLGMWFFPVVLQSFTLKGRARACQALVLSRENLRCRRNRCKRESRDWTRV